MDRSAQFLDILQSNLHLLLPLLLLGVVVLILEVAGLRFIFLCAFPIAASAFVGKLVKLDRLSKLRIFVQYFTFLLHLLSRCCIVGILMHILKIHDLFHWGTILTNICVIRFEMV